MACALSVFDLALASALKSSQFPHPTGLLKAFTFSGGETTFPGRKNEFFFSHKLRCPTVEKLPKLR
jgi:hypothetical protein